MPDRLTALTNKVKLKFHEMYNPASKRKPFEIADEGIAALVELDAEARRYRKALEFYADERRYNVDEDGSAVGWEQYDGDPVLHDNGEVARTALAGVDPPIGRYQIALRHDDMGLDDVVVKDVEMFRMERMHDDTVWMACYLNDGQDIHLDLWVKKGKVYYSAREPLPEVKYEPQKGEDT